MESLFFLEQEEKNKKLYIDLLDITGSLSNMFADSKNPFLYYRAMENIFCKSFNADNLSRSDISVDASKNGIGVGLKTFLQSSGNTFQKIAEFNKDSYLFRDLKGMELIKKVSLMRNERIKSTMKICNLKDMMYHMITRSENYMAIYEEKMDLINIDKIEIISQKNSTIHFSDELHDYNFSLSKNTLLKRFITNEKNKLHGFEVKILEDPYEFLLNLKDKIEFYNVDLKNGNNLEIDDYIVLPLYSTRTKKVELSSGLNQWNAKGRKRDPDEVYIPIPAWIHKIKKNFFEYNTDDNKTAPFEYESCSTRWKKFDEQSKFRFRKMDFKRYFRIK